MREAARGGAELVALPEMAVTSYPPRDLLLDPAFVDRAAAVTGEIARDLDGGPPVVLGTVLRSGRETPGHPGLLDAAVVLGGGRLAASAAKRLLPAYDVFHEPRWFVPGAASAPLRVGDAAVGLLVCEDLWDEGHPVHPPAELRAAGADRLVCVSASPYRTGVGEERLRHARRAGLPLAYVNAVGANDELIFDGGSFVVDGDGRETFRLPRFREAVAVAGLGEGEPALPAGPDLGPEEVLFEALVLGVGDFAAKNGLPRAFLGLSGGVDSALVACVAAAALGPRRVTALVLPSRHTDPRSTAAGRELAGRLGIACEEVGIDPLHESARAVLGPLLAGDSGTTDENLQARLRALVLTAHVNRRGGLLLNTSNKTELSLGYGTLYGDLAGTLSVIGDLTKTEVYALARWHAARFGSIPAFVLEREPTAELRPGQVDPFDYPAVAPLVERLVRGDPTHGDEAERLARLVRASEHKRFQHGIVLKVTGRAFGTGRLVPVTRAW